MKKFLTALWNVALLAAPVGASFAYAQTAPSYRVLKGRGHVHASGRCHGMSYGTGARSCGTATGGPVGGLSSRN